jgi:hypothetical protein
MNLNAPRIASPPHCARSRRRGRPNLPHSLGTIGGESGELGRNTIRRNGGRVEALPRCTQAEVDAGEAIEIVTPTGGLATVSPWTIGLDNFFRYSEIPAIVGPMTGSSVSALRPQK